MNEIMVGLITFGLQIILAISQITIIIYLISSLRKEIKTYKNNLRKNNETNNSEGGKT